MVVKLAYEVSALLNRKRIRAIATCGGALGRIREGRMIPGDIDFDFIVRDVERKELEDAGFYVTRAMHQGAWYLRVRKEGYTFNGMPAWVDLYTPEALRQYTFHGQGNTRRLFDSYFVDTFMGYSFLWTNLEINLITNLYYPPYSIDNYENYADGSPVRLKAKRVVFDGVFDPLHAGHIDFIRRIKQELGESECMLFVAVISDAWATEYKGKPFIDEDNRLAVVQALKDVDVAFIANSPEDLKGFDEYVTSEEYNRPDSTCDWSRDMGTLFLPRSSYMSSTEIKENGQ